MNSVKYRTLSHVLWTAAFILAASALVASCTRPDSSADNSEEKRRAVLEFYDLAINQKDFDAAEAYMGPHYIQHNPMAKDGKDGLRDFVDYLRSSQPDYHSRVVRSFVDGDYVILHVHNTPSPGDPGKAIVDIFRLENGKVVEHWDVIQPIPANPANDNTMF